MAELKPCPFCGCTPIVMANQFRHGQTTYLVKCNCIDCAVIPTTYEHSEMYSAIEAWNRRAEDGK